MPDQNSHGERIAALEATQPLILKNLEDLQNNVAELLRVAHTGKGAFWASMTFASVVGGVISWAAHAFFSKGG